MEGGGGRWRERLPVEGSRGNSPGGGTGSAALQRSPGKGAPRRQHRVDRLARVCCGQAEVVLLERANPHREVRHGDGEPHSTTEVVHNLVHRTSSKAQEGSQKTQPFVCMSKLSP